MQRLLRALLVQLVRHLPGSQGAPHKVRQVGGGVREGIAPLMLWAQSPAGESSLLFCRLPNRSVAAAAKIQEGAVPPMQQQAISGGGIQVQPQQPQQQQSSWPQGGAPPSQGGMPPQLGPPQQSWPQVQPQGGAHPSQGGMPLHPQASFMGGQPQQFPSPQPQYPSPQPQQYPHAQQPYPSAQQQQPSQAPYPLQPPAVQPAMRPSY